jgi:hypothetical protein
LKPATRIKVGLRAALRRRYAYAALRRLRRASSAAWSAHWRGTFGAAPYAGTGQADAIAAAYSRALARLRRRWPNLLSWADDPRAQP